MSGAALDPKKVRAARMEELEHVRKKCVWRKIPRSEARRRGLKIIAVRWIDGTKEIVRGSATEAG